MIAFHANNREKYFQNVGTVFACSEFMREVHFSNTALNRSRAGAKRSCALTTVNEWGRMAAAEILQTYLDRMSVAVIEGRLEAYVAHVALPFTLSTGTATLRVDTLEELEEGFDSYSEMLADLGVTSMQRSVVRAFSPNSATVHGQYTTRLLAGNRQVAPLFWSQIRLDLIEGVWKSGFIRNTTTDSRWPVLIPNVHRSQTD